MKKSVFKFSGEILIDEKYQTLFDKLTGEEKITLVRESIKIDKEYPSIDIKVEQNG